MRSSGRSGSGACARNPTPTQNQTLSADHGFIFQIARFNALAKPTQIKYGAIIHAAAAFTAENSRMVQAIDSPSATVTNTPAPRFPAPQNTGAQRALSRS